MSPRAAPAPAASHRWDFVLSFSSAVQMLSQHLLPVPPQPYIQLPLGPHPIWGVSPCHSSPCTISLFLLAPNLTSHFTQQDLSQAKLFLNSCLAIIRITPGDSWARGQTVLLTLRFLFLLLFHFHSLSSDVPSSRHESSSKNAKGKRHCCGHLFPKHWGRQHVLLVGYS